MGTFQVAAASYVEEEPTNEQNRSDHERCSFASSALIAGGVVHNEWLKISLSKHSFKLPRNATDT
jgi:hypothetical protein